ncbi:MAG: beta-ketoacyl-[acyl-carrier-protein] synthase II [Candidatus Schekmanbacteria bacterium RBG_13_48_7]|uniref:3-oxoacyl-[acyl-carrier-protein] synthase 2 n=1 Tax=Candidatus Schekmanbacteria bacterium RBG_13_48_7 TaxID=1817878 RepID=A0A1F7RRR0_9BACT|nr:MAG: beta-ketoacyl-[acyl-carrier-protein] synthase II [Candidatus Schekmanbacteria bacterium RBG_13_48_7]
MQKRVVVTGLGILSPIGSNLKDFCENLRNGISGIRKITHFDASTYPSQIAGEIKDLDPLNHLSPRFINKTDRFTQLGVIATKLALQDSHLELQKIDLNRIGVVIGTSIGGLSVAEEQHTIFLEKGYKRINPFMQTSVFPSSCSSHIALYFNFHGSAETISTACASSNSAVGHAMGRIFSGDCDIVVTGGSDAAITPFILGSFCSLRLVSRKNEEPEKACKPFSKDRDGFALSEGCGILILEELEHALRRDAFIYGELLGYGATCDAHHITSSAPDAVYASMAMEKALKNANIDRTEIDYINCHGSATPSNDPIETLAIKKTFREKAYEIPISATKSMVGHTMGACGSIELVACFIMLQHGFIHPTINYNTPDPDCDLFYVPNHAIEKQLNRIMSISLGYGGQNSVIVLQRFKSL